MRIWITNYALTQGIIEVEHVERSHTDSMVTHINQLGFRECYHKPHWHESLQDAQKYAESMRQKKLRSLRKQITKLESLRFEGDE